MAPNWPRSFGEESHDSERVRIKGSWERFIAYLMILWIICIGLTVVSHDAAYVECGFGLIAVLAVFKRARMRRQLTRLGIEPRDL